MVTNCLHCHNYCFLNDFTLQRLNGLSSERKFFEKNRFTNIKRQFSLIALSYIIFFFLEANQPLLTTIQQLEEELRVKTNDFESSLSQKEKMTNKILEEKSDCFY